MGLADRGEGLSSLGHCTRWLVIMLSILTFIAGATVAGLGLYFLMKENDISAIMGHAFMTIVASVVVAAGLLMILTSVVGIVGAIALSKELILGYIALISLICFLLVGGGVMALAFKSQINEEVRNSLFESLRMYGDRDQKHITDAWDRTQQWLYCCAVDQQNWNAYRQTPWYRDSPGDPDHDKPIVPKSCCNRNQYGEYINIEKCQLTRDGPPSSKAGAYNEALNYQGCYTAARNHAEEFFGYAAGIGFGVLVVTILSLIFAVLLLIQLRKNTTEPRNFHMAEQKLKY